jgi:hypothetical protein
MAKAHINKVTEDFIQKKKTSKSQKTKKSKSQEVKKQHTVYLTEEASNLAWQNRANTGETISDFITRLITESLGKK